jgi:hypothetical protein
MFKRNELKYCKKPTIEIAQKWNCLLMLYSEKRNIQRIKFKYQTFTRRHQHLTHSMEVLSKLNLKGKPISYHSLSFSGF